MTDDTSTWLKKNPLIHPMGRSLKTSLRFHVNGSEMDASIMSNPGKANDKQIFVPRMMQRPSLVTKKLNQKFKFKVPTNVMAGNEANQLKKPRMETKSANCGPSRKSFLPVKNQPQSCENNAVVRSLMRPSFLSRSSARKNTARRDLIQRFVDASLQNNLNGCAQSNLTSAETVETIKIRSILKKQRVSLRRTSQLSKDHQKKSAKKVLFEGYENICVENEKESELNFSSLSIRSGSDFNPLDEPTVFFNFPTSSLVGMNSSPDSSIVSETEKGKPEESKVAEVPEESTNLIDVLKAWKIYTNKVDQLKSKGNALKDSLRVHLEQSQALENQFRSYVKSCEESYRELERIGQEMEENLRKSLETEKENAGPRPERNSMERRKSPRENSHKIKLSGTSKAIKKSGKKSKLDLKKKSDLWMGKEEENF